MRTQIELENMIKQYAQTYYTGNSEVSDEYFDSLIDELREVAPESELLVTPGWGYAPEGKKVPHMYGMTVGSLSKVKSVNNIPETYNPYNCRISAKLDGISVVSYYKNGKRILSLTRGNGVEGKVVTDKINKISPNTEDLSNMNISELPKKFTGAVRGEVLFSRDNWNALKNKYENATNPRNVAAGIMNRDYIDDDDIRYLSYVVYKVVALDPSTKIDNNNYGFRLLESLMIYSQFEIVPYADAIYSAKFSQSELESLYNNFNRTYPCDGLVITKKNISHKSKGEIVYDEIAYKFKSESEEVEVTNVDWNATRTGRVVPRVWFDPVQLSGAVVQKCTGYNAAFIRDNKINKGTVVEVTRSNEVIPTIVQVISNSNEEGLLPDSCPNCGAPLVWKGEDLVCENENEDQLIYRFISVLGNVDGAGSSLYNKIIEVFRLDEFLTLLDFIDIAKSDYQEVYNTIYNHINGIATRNKCEEVVTKIISPIDPTYLLVACNINGISWTTATNLLKEYPDYFIDVIKGSVNYDEIKNISGFGPVLINTLKHFEDRIKQLAVRLNIKDVETEDDSIDTQFYVAITGSLSMKRSDFDALLSKKGIHQSSNFKQIKYLITNNPDSTSSKMKKARSAGIEVISEEDFMNKYLI